MNVFDYRQHSNSDTMKGGALSGYRLMHWLADILRNWFSDPVNIKDQRISRLLRLQDGESQQNLNALFDIGTPYAQDTRKACSTPMIIVSLGDTTYPVHQLTTLNGAGGAIAENGAIPMCKGQKYRSISCKVAVITQSYDGTVLLSNLIEDFLCINEYNLVRDNGMISSFSVMGSTAPVEIKQGTAANAKPVYQSIITVTVCGGISWYTDTQGPVFRGLSTTMNIQ